MHRSSRVKNSDDDFESLEICAFLFLLVHIPRAGRVQRPDGQTSVRHPRVGVGSILRALSPFALAFLALYDWAGTAGSDVAAAPGWLLPPPLLGRNQSLGN